MLPCPPGTRALPWGVPSLAALRHAPWSQSKIQTALRCGRDFHYRYVERIPERDVSPAQRIGKALHLGLERLLGGTPLPTSLAEGRRELLAPEELERYDRLAPNVGAFLTRIDAFRARRRPRATLIEHQLAVDDALHPTSFLADGALFRGVLDLAFEWGEGELAVLDHKTGGRQALTSYADQLDGYAVLAVMGLPRVRRLWLGVHFLADADVAWAAPVSAEHVRAQLAPRLLQVIDQAGQAAAVGDVPNPGRHCAWCGYRSLCPAAQLPAEPEPEPPPEPVIVPEAVTPPLEE